MSSAGALRGTEPPGRRRAGVWAAVEHLREYPPSTPTTNTPGSKCEKDSEVTPTAASPQAIWGKRELVSAGAPERATRGQSLPGTQRAVHSTQLVTGLCF